MLVNLVSMRVQLIYVIGRLGGPYSEKHFQARGHSFLLYRPTLSWTIACLSFPVVVNWLTSGFVYTTLSLNWLTRCL